MVKVFFHAQKDSAVAAAILADLGYVPFVSSYPIITTRYRSSEEFENREGFLIQYIFKPQPLSRGDYVFTLQVPPDLKLCRLEVTHIGENLPCLQRPQAVLGKIS